MATTNDANFGRVRSAQQERQREAQARRRAQPPLQTALGPLLEKAIIQKGSK